MNIDYNCDSFYLAIVQSKLFWEDSRANLNYFESQINSLKKAVQLIVLPETFSTGFTMNVEEYADQNDETLKWMIHQAKKNEVFLTGSVIVKEGAKYYNRLYWVNPKGAFEYYDKRHLFRMGREHESFSSGDKRVVVNLGKARILLQICYDLRFPVFARNRGDYDIILYVANWPTPRQLVWETLLPARAIENQCYVIGANRSGIDGEGEETCGGSCVVNPKGEIKTRLSAQPGLLVSSINLEELISFRKNFPVSQDSDDFSLLL
ncbi:amidohydrolase [Bacteroidota bacterium]